MKIERRIVAGHVELRAAGEKRQIVGHAGVYNREAIIAGMFRERIAPGAFDAVIGPLADVRGLFNHDANMVLGRTTAGTLVLSTDDIGLRYVIDPPNTSYANDLLESLSRGDVTQSSYAFAVKTDEWTKPTRAGELPLRTIKEFEFLYDVSPVTFPAFEETTAEARSAALAQHAAIPDVTEDAAAILRARAELDIVEVS